MPVMTRNEALAQLTAEGAAYEITSGLERRPSRYFKKAPLTLGDLFKRLPAIYRLPFTKRARNLRLNLCKECGACSSAQARMQGCQRRSRCDCYAQLSLTGLFLYGDHLTGCRRSCVERPWQTTSWPTGFACRRPMVNCRR